MEGAGVADERTTYRVRKIFVVLDPMRLMQPALEKAERIAALNGATLHLYCCVDSAPIAFRRDALAMRTRDWVERLAERPRRQGLEVSLQVETKSDWRKAIAEAATHSGSDLVAKTVSPHGPLARRFMETSDWTLLRNCARPILLVNPLQFAVPKTVLAAVKLNPGDDIHVALNQRVVDTAHQIADALDAELHTVTVYQDDDIYFDRQQFADACRLPRNRVYATRGSSYQGIAQVAEKIGAGVVIVGCAQGATGSSMLGDTAQRVIDVVRSDVIVLPAA